MTESEQGRRAALAALELAALVREHSRDTITGWLRGRDRLALEQLAVAAACMVDVERTPSELLAWVPQPDGPQPLTVQGDPVRSAHARYEAARKAGRLETLSALERKLEREYQARRHARRKAMRELAKRVAA